MIGIGTDRYRNRSRTGRQVQTSLGGTDSIDFAKRPR